MPKVVRVRDKMTYIGIDPGKSGGIAVIQGRKVECFRMPNTEKDGWSIFAENKEGRVFAVIEKVHSMPGQGVKSMFSFGQNYGFLRGCLTAAQIPFEEITPQAWQKGLSIPPRAKTETKPQFKERLRQKAQQLFPQEAVWGRTLGEQRAVCDALLIAEYCRRIRQ
jgi:hypothetical protein